MERGTSELEFTRAWMQAQPAVVSVLLAMVRDRAAVEDLVQDVSLAAYTQWAQRDPARAFTPWVIGIAQHKAIDWQRRRAVRSQVIRQQGALDALAAAATELQDELGEREMALHECIGGLPERERTVLQLHYVEEQPVQNIASRMKLTVANVKVLLHRLRGALRTCISRRLGLQES